MVRHKLTWFRHMVCRYRAQFRYVFQYTLYKWLINILVIYFISYKLHFFPSLSASSEVRPEMNLWTLFNFLFYVPFFFLVMSVEKLQRKTTFQNSNCWENLARLSHSALWKNLENNSFYLKTRWRCGAFFI